MVAYRLNQAQDTLDQAEILARAKKWPGVINRGYYAMFYAALALLLDRGLQPRKHTGVLSLIDREYVRSGLLPREQSIHLRAAFFARENADYLDTVPADPVRAKAVLQNAGTFLGAVRAVLQRVSREPPDT